MSAAVRTSSPIPASARKVVQDLKEIVNNSDDEIYAMLKECNMDPNETAQRLLSQDTFHEVKRKRDKKKDNSSKDFAETRSRASAVVSSIRGARSRGQNYTPRSNSEYSSSSRGPPIGSKDSAPHQNGRAAKNSGFPTVYSEVQAQSKSAIVNISNDSSFGSATTSSSTIPNGTSLYSKVVQGTGGVWGTGQATLAEIVKSSAALQGHAIANASIPSKVVTQQPDHLLDDTLPLSTDHEIDSSVDVGTTGSTSGKQSGVVVGSLVPDPTGSFREVTEKNVSIHQSSTYAHSDTSSSIIKTINSDSPSSSAPTSMSRDIITELEIGVSAELSSLKISCESPDVHLEGSPVMSNQYSGRVSYQSQATGTEKGSGVDWRPKSPTAASPPYRAFNSGSDSASASRSISGHDNIEPLKIPGSKLQQLIIHDDQPVIIPDHLRVPEADRTQLNFGSFGEDFSKENFPDEEDEDNKSTESAEDNIPDEEADLKETTAASLKTSEPITSNYSNQAMAANTLVGREDTTINLAQPEVTKSESTLQQHNQHSPLPAMPSFSGAGSMPQIVSNQFTYEQSESQTQDAPRVQNFMSYSDPATNANFFNPVFRPNADLDARYAQFVSASASSKYNPTASLISGQSLSASQETGNSVVLPSTSHLTQTSQTVGLTQGSLTIPQQHIPIHAYPAQHAGVPLTPFGGNVLGIHYVPPSYGYVHSPYQHSYVGSTGYPQATGSNYAPGNNYTPAAGAPYNSATSAAALKYALPQYKPGTTGNLPHATVATGYGNFGTSPSGFTTINSAATSATASGYDDVNGPQYKENNLFVPSQQQAEGSGVWIQNMPSRDMTPMQTNSYYNLLCQSQHTSFTHTQPMHGAVPTAAYASLYHQSQSGSAPAVHQLLQQPQTLGTVGGVGSQSGAYPQQRGQLNWPPNY